MNIPQLTALCLRYQGVLLDASEEVVHVAVVDAPSHELLDALHFATTKRIEITCWTRQQMEGHASRTQQTLPVAVQEKHQPKAELLTRTLQSALEQRASDIHIEPADNAYRIRLRIDGVLHPLPDVSPDAGVALTARLKVLGNLDIAEHRLPQDGQFTVELAGNAVSFRIATLPCRGGEKVVLRLLQQVSQALDVNTLGMQPLQLADFAHALQQPQGLVLVTGPTGSGKTVTLYSALQTLNTADINNEDLRHQNSSSWSQSDGLASAENCCRHVTGRASLHFPDSAGLGGRPSPSISHLWQRLRYLLRRRHRFCR